MKSVRLYLKEPIERMVLILIVIFKVSLLLLLTFDRIFEKTENEYKTLIENQQNQRKLGRVLIRDLITLEKDFYEAASFIKFKELNWNNIEVLQNIEEIKSIISILQKGGEFEDTIPVNFYDIYEIKEEFEFVKLEPYYAIEAIDLLPKILDLEEIYNKLYLAINCSSTCADNQSKIAAEKEVILLLKQADTYFLRSRESANKIFYESHQKILVLEEEEERLIQIYNIARLIIFGVVILTFLILSAVIIIKIGREINVRKKAEKELLNSRKKLEDYSRNLEKKIKERTEKLEKANERLKELDKEKDELNKEADREDRQEDKQKKKREKRQKEALKKRQQQQREGRLIKSKIRMMLT